MEYTLAHIGINTNSPGEAAELANLLCSMFNLTPKHGNKSEFAGSYFECMKMPFLGKNGHIGMYTADCEAAVKDLEARGYEVDMSTAGYRPDGTLNAVYLKQEVGGFAVHIVRKPD